jgi:hypothetical protein
MAKIVVFVFGYHREDGTFPPAVAPGGTPFSVVILRSFRVFYRLTRRRQRRNNERLFRHPAIEILFFDDVILCLTQNPP